MCDEKEAREFLERFDKLRPKDAFKRLDDNDRTAHLILLLLCRAEGEVCAGDLSAKLCMSTPRVAAGLKALESRGLITRRAQAKDARKVVVTVTDAGRAEYDKHEKERLNFAMSVIDEIGEDDLNEFLRILGRFHEIAQRKKSEN
ncbi:MAG: winged helix-turn-helix transcriptional regulator [Clostridiales bacterium]|nr:winged helix-turn-helix transcriptional regulator [Clostridiales bacterium]